MARVSGQTLIRASLALLLAGLVAAQLLLHRDVGAQDRNVEAPRFEVDPMWPKPLPNHWILGHTIGVSVDAQDNVWIIHRAGSPNPANSTPHQPALAQPPIAAPPRLRS